MFGYRPADPKEISFEYLPIGDAYVFCGGKADYDIEKYINQDVDVFHCICYN
jgi:hypothetical protein